MSFWENAGIHYNIIFLFSSLWECRVSVCSTTCTFEMFSINVMCVENKEVSIRGFWEIGGCKVEQSGINTIQWFFVFSSSFENRKKWTKGRKCLRTSALRVFKKYLFCLVAGLCVSSWFLLVPVLVFSLSDVPHCYTPNCIDSCLTIPK